MKRSPTPRPCLVPNCHRLTRTARGICGRCNVGGCGGAGEPPQPTKGPPSSPTAASPGSSAKVEELRRRLWAGEQLWHPLDEREQGPGSTPLVSAYARGTEARKKSRARAKRAKASARSKASAR
jgi:hypothetical protein